MVSNSFGYGRSDRDFLAGLVVSPEPAQFVKKHPMSNENISHLERSDCPVNREFLRAIAYLLWQLHEHHVSDHHSSDE